MSKTVEDVLAHYGVKGMKWGVRRSQAELDRAAGRTPRRKSKSARKREASSLSDEELRSRINRIQMERQYVQLTTPAPPAVQKFVTDVLANSGKNIATSQVTKRGGQGVDALIAAAMKKAQQ